MKQMHPTKEALDRTTRLDFDIYLILETNGDGVVTDFPRKEDGSPNVKAFDNPFSAERSLRGMKIRDLVSQDARVLKVTRVMEPI